MTKQRRVFSAEFKREAADLVLSKITASSKPVAHSALASRLCAVGLASFNRNAQV